MTELRDCENSVSSGVLQTLNHYRTLLTFLITLQIWLLDCPAEDATYTSHRKELTPVFCWSLHPYWVALLASGGVMYAPLEEKRSDLTLLLPMNPVAKD